MDNDMSGEVKSTIPEAVGDTFLALAREAGATVLLAQLNVVAATPVGWLVKEVYYVIFDNTVVPAIKGIELQFDYAIIKKQVSEQIDAINKATTIEEAINAFDNLT
jgi:hypothetical protein